jgi:hypothetical protein
MSYGLSIEGTRNSRSDRSSGGFGNYSVVESTESGSSGSSGDERSYGRRSGRDSGVRTIWREITGIVDSIEIIHESSGSYSVERGGGGVGNDSTSTGESIGILEGIEGDTRFCRSYVVTGIATWDISLTRENEVSGLGGSIGEFSDRESRDILEDDTWKSKVVGSERSSCLYFNDESVVVPSYVCSESIGSCSIYGSYERREIGGSVVENVVGVVLSVSIECIIV